MSETLPFALQFEKVPCPDDAGMEALLLDHMEPVLRQMFDLPPQAVIDRINKHDKALMRDTITMRTIDTEHLHAINQMIWNNTSQSFFITVEAENPLESMFKSQQTDRISNYVALHVAQTLSQRDVVFKSTAHGTNVVRAILAEKQYRHLFLDEFRAVRDAYHADIRALEQGRELIERGDQFIRAYLFGGEVEKKVIESLQIHAKPYAIRYGDIPETGFEFYVDTPNGLLHQPFGLRVDSVGNMHAKVGDGWSVHEVIGADSVPREYMGDITNLVDLRKHFVSVIS